MTLPTTLLNEDGKSNNKNYNMKYLKPTKLTKTIQRYSANSTILLTNNID